MEKTKQRSPKLTPKFDYDPILGDKVKVFEKEKQAPSSENVIKSVKGLSRDSISDALERAVKEMESDPTYPDRLREHQRKLGSLTFEDLHTPIG